MVQITNTAIRLLCKSFRKDTYTIEIRRGTPGLDELIELGLIQRHPDILASSMSYYRTEEGVLVWRTMHGPESN